jgi:hypothetical protein
MSKVLDNEVRIAAEKADGPARAVEPAVRVDDLSVRLSLQREVVLSLRETVVRFLERRPVETEEFWPLRNVSFTAGRGEVFGSRSSRASSPRRSGASRRAAGSRRCSSSAPASTRT